MTSEKKRLLIKFIIWAVIAIFAAILIALWQLDRLAAASTRTIGSMITGTQVDVKSISIKPLDGMVRVQGFTVGNPEGFHNANAIKVGNFHIEMNISSLFSDKLEIKNLEISGAALDFEYTISRGSNLDVLLKNVEKNVGTNNDQASAADKPQPKKKDDAAPRQLVIRKLVFKDSRVTVSSGAFRNSMVIPLLPIEMTDVGENKDLAGTAAEILSRLLTEVLKVVDIKKLGQSLSDVGENIINGIDKATGSVGGAVVSAGDSAGNAVNNALDKSKNLIKALPGVGR